jgi:hypothetical protein
MHHCKAPLFLQLKEARASVLEAYAKRASSPTTGTVVKRTPVDAIGQ